MKAMIGRVLVCILCLAALSFPARSPVQAEAMTCPPHTPVVIDIRPGSPINWINLSSRGVVPVAVLTTQAFDASQFTPEMAHLTDATTVPSMGCTGAMAVGWIRLDVNGDGRPDLVFFFKTQDLDLTSSSTAASLMAHGIYDSTPLHILGTDSVKILTKHP
jgi:hypothetical protein